MVESTDISAHGLYRLVEKTRRKRFCKSCGSYVLYVLSDEETLYGQQHSTGHGICNKHILWSQHQKYKESFLTLLACFIVSYANIVSGGAEKIMNNQIRFGLGQ